MISLIVSTKQVVAQSNYVVNQVISNDMPSNATVSYEFTNDGHFNYTFVIPTHPGVFSNSFGDGGVSLYDTDNSVILENNAFNYPSSHEYSTSITLQGSVNIGTSNRNCELFIDFTVPNPYGSLDGGTIWLDIEIYP